MVGAPPTTARRHNPPDPSLKPETNGRGRRLAARVPGGARSPIPFQPVAALRLRKISKNTSFTDHAAILSRIEGGASPKMQIIKKIQYLVYFCLARREKRVMITP
jgi:hypothetical protein